MNYSKFLSKRALRREPSAIRALLPLLKIDGMISFGGGFPNADLFPIRSLSITTSSGELIQLDPGLREALQYSSSYGHAGLLSWLRGFQRVEHVLGSTSDWDMLITNGSQDGLEKAFQMLVDEGDTVVTEAPTYSGALSALLPLGCRVESIECDAEGLRTDDLSSRLASGLRPKFVYTIPTGQNPSGGNLSARRRRALLDLAVKYDFLILEDDPYYFLQFTNQTDRASSLLSLDRARVLRFDSLSKVISGGMRIGYVTGPQFLIEKLQLHQQASGIHASGISQLVAEGVLRHMGEDGFRRHVALVESEYKKRRDCFVALLEKHVSEYFDWRVPDAGMFVWLRLKSGEDALGLIQKEAVEAKVLMVPGTFFYADKRVSPCVRGSYATATFEDMEKGILRLKTLFQ